MVKLLHIIPHGFQNVQDVRMEDVLCLLEGLVFVNVMMNIQGNSVKHVSNSYMCKSCIKRPLSKKAENWFLRPVID